MLDLNLQYCTVYCIGALPQQFEFVSVDEIKGNYEEKLKRGQKVFSDTTIRLQYIL